MGAAALQYSRPRMLTIVGITRMLRFALAIEREERYAPAAAGREGIT